ncbi:hypothetical protein FZ025_12475 [Xanthomonas hyacinthi]|nr:hypothetical protein FZ025_12475 [Xanthomonas hyacinthi]
MSRPPRLRPTTIRTPLSPSCRRDSSQGASGKPGAVHLSAAPGEAFARSIFEAGGVEPNIRFRTLRFEHARALVAESFGCLLYAQPLAMETASWAGRLEIRPVTEPAANIRLILVQRRHGGLTRRSELFIAHCLGAVKRDRS